MNESIKNVINEIEINYRILSTNSDFLSQLDINPKLKKKLNLEAEEEETDMNWSEINCIYVGAVDDSKIIAWALQHQPKQLIVIDRKTGNVTRNPIDVGRKLMQRFYLIEKAKGTLLIMSHNL